VKKIEVFSTKEAVANGVAEIDSTARLSDNVRFVPFEDDGSSCGIIRIGADCLIRDGCTICSGVVIGRNSVLGHQVVVRRRARIGDHTVISHLTCIEFEVKIGSWVRISPLTHICGRCLIEDEVVIGARVATVHDREMRWVEKLRTGVERDPVVSPIFRRGCRVGSGSTILTGVEIGERSLVGAGSVVTRSLPANVIAYGVPAYVQRELGEDEANFRDFPADIECDLEPLVGS